MKKRLSSITMTRGNVVVLAIVVVLCLLALSAFVMRSSASLGFGRGLPEPQQDETARPLPSANATDRANAATVLGRLGDLVRRQPEELVGQGRFVYIQTKQVDIGQVTLHEAWYDSEGLILLQLKVAGARGDVLWPDPARPRAATDEIAAKRIELRKNGPSGLRPTPEWINELPEDPSALLVQMRKAFNGDPTDPSLEKNVLEAVVLLLSAAPALIPPGVQRTFYDMLTLMPSVGAKHAETSIVDGQNFFVIELFEGTELVFDPVTGRALGTRSGDAVWQFWDTNRVPEIPVLKS